MNPAELETKEFSTQEGDASEKPAKDEVVEEPAEEISEEVPPRIGANMLFYRTEEDLLTYPSVRIALEIAKGLEPPKVK